MDLGQVDFDGTSGGFSTYAMAAAMTATALASAAITTGVQRFRRLAPPAVLPAGPTAGPAAGAAQNAINPQALEAATRAVAELVKQDLPAMVQRSVHAAIGPHATAVNARLGQHAEIMSKIVNTMPKSPKTAVDHILFHYDLRNDWNRFLEAKDLVGGLVSLVANVGFKWIGVPLIGRESINYATDGYLDQSPEYQSATDTICSYSLATPWCDPGIILAKGSYMGAHVGTRSSLRLGDSLVRGTCGALQESAMDTLNDISQFANRGIQYARESATQLVPSSMSFWFSEHKVSNETALISLNAHAFSDPEMISSSLGSFTLPGTKPGQSDSLHMSSVATIAGSLALLYLVSLGIKTSLEEIEAIKKPPVQLAKNLKEAPPKVAAA